MGKRYGHVTIEERCEIARLQAEGRSIRQIAADLDRSPSTVARELTRNVSRTGDYKGGSPASFMAMRRSIAERPESVADRRTPGHWEADLMLFRTYGHAVLTMHERHSRMLIAVRPPGKASTPIADAMSQALGQLPSDWRRTVTFDNGTEFALHYRLHDLGIETFFCDTHSPWQKGGVENAIGRLRRTLPRKTDLAALPEEQFTQMIQAYNNTPRKCLDYKTPAEIFLDSVLHLKCESTFRLSRGRRVRRGGKTGVGAERRVGPLGVGAVF